MSTRHKAIAMFFAGIMLGGVIAVFVVQGRRAPAGVRPAGAETSIPASRRTAIVTAAERVSPAVVSVSVINRVVRSDPFAGMMRDEFWDRFNPPLEYRERIPGLGSGVIVGSDGTVLTNEHVIRNAESITVTLSDGRQLPARLLGASATYDLAVLQVSGSKIPVAPLGNSDQLVVGEWAIAIGNPFGFLLSDTQPTVTAGVVSAMHRDVKSEATETGVYKNMIQTDAAINPGNSGGPLVNGDGEVIGINAFIFTKGGGSLGIGFAIPINLARRILEEIRTYGRVRAAWPGMQVQPVTPHLARRLGFTDLTGLVVTRVDPNGPAASAGVRIGDRVRRVNGQVIQSVDDAQKSIYGASVGDRLKFTLERAGQTLEATVTLAEAPGGGAR